MKINTGHAVGKVFLILRFKLALSALCWELMHSSRLFFDTAQCCFTFFKLNKHIGVRAEQPGLYFFKCSVAD